MDTEKLLLFVNRVKKSGVLEVDNLRDRRSMKIKREKWEAIHNFSKDLGLTMSNDFMQSRKRIWYKLKKDAQDKLTLLRSKQILQLSKLEKMVLSCTGLTDSEINALEAAAHSAFHTSNALVVVKKEKNNLETELMISDDEDICSEMEPTEKNRRLNRQYLKAKILKTKLKSFKLMKEVGINSTTFLNPEDFII